MRHGTSDGFQMGLASVWKNTGMEHVEKELGGTRSDWPLLAEEYQDS